MTGSNNAIYAGAGGVGGIGFAPTSEYIGMALQELYNHVENSAFYASAPPQMRPFYRKVQNWERWINGVVLGFHDFNKGVIPTHLAKAIVDKISALVYGGGIMLQGAGVSGDDVRDETLDFISEWARRTNLRSVVQSCIRFTAGLGTGCFKLNADGEGQLWVEAVPMSRARYTKDARGDVSSARFIIRTFERDTVKDGEIFGLFEERYYQTDENGARAPYCVYKVYRIRTAANQSQLPNECYLSWEELPKWVRIMLKDSYYSIRLDAPIRMPFVELGLFPYLWTPCVSSMPHLPYGDSVLEGLNKYLCEYDIISACLDTETYVSRARVMAKKPMQNPQKANYNSGLDSFLLTYYEELGNESKPIVFIQPEIRSEEFKALRNMTLENISTAIGISPSSFASYLQDGSNRTAREVSAEESATTLTVENKREGLLVSLNALLDAVCSYYGLRGRVKVEFSKAGQTNYTLLVENAVKIYQAGGSSLEQFVRTVNPNMDEQQIAREIALIKSEERERDARRAGFIRNNTSADSDFTLTSKGGE